MTKEEQKKEAVIEQPKEAGIEDSQPKQVAIKDIPTERLKAIAFDLMRQYKSYQTQYNQVANEIQIREQEEVQK